MIKKLAKLLIGFDWRKRGYLFFALAFLIISPAVCLAISSASYIIDPSGTDAIHHISTSASYKLEGSIEPITGKTTTANYALEHGSSFAGYCGDGAIDPSEDCEGANLNGKTCATQGFTSGTLACNTNCTFNTGACITVTPSVGGGGGGINPIIPPVFDPALRTFTYSSAPLIYGTKADTIIYVYVNGSKDGVTYPTKNRWQKNVPLPIGQNTIKIKSWNNYDYSADVTKVITRRLMGDINNDGRVNDYDFSLLANNWSKDWADADFNEDKMVNDYDLSLMVAYWTG